MSFQNDCLAIATNDAAIRQIDIHHRDNNKDTILAYAASNNLKSCLEPLLKAGSLF